jgi:hypothetical protein
MAESYQSVAIGRLIRPSRSVAAGCADTNAASSLSMNI